LAVGLGLAVVLLYSPLLARADGDRSTTMGFVGAIESSEAYCAMRIWPEGNARTHPVTSGQITRHVN
jgi:hypothetical protein